MGHHRPRHAALALVLVLVATLWALVGTGSAARASDTGCNAHLNIQLVHDGEQEIIKSTARVVCAAPKKQIYLRTTYRYFGSHSKRRLAFEPTNGCVQARRCATKHANGEFDDNPGRYCATLSWYAGPGPVHDSTPCGRRRSAGTTSSEHSAVRC